ncbi:uncharacterized protein EDB93DRAFT_1161392 [Suillus bovinus]|uniref:uncharacterized protein n=1 Tax=Suillus bovinus TaxID=48563 RepID=UPI001B8696BE|nr:uncharacterized protein EDB93DRAFT_1195535 [Suillus bovinus]XP_041305222.1 uncharacterized protein EDB93DRAFT_1161392 [Suillus bovinus]KAG2123299.1 hypothetical protein EDB93DRAFT_1195535 [Suillus bovinus]KAG2140484.1 hypothetical protein EDB93DRAFT_1161392 [Suillus bovinus]
MRFAFLTVIIALTTSVTAFGPRNISRMVLKCVVNYVSAFSLVLCITRPLKLEVLNGFNYRSKRAKQMRASVFSSYRGKRVKTKSVH